MEETKHERFKRLAEARTGRILDTLDLIGNLANTSFYEYSEEEIESIFNAIENAAKVNKAKFNKKIKEKRRFTL